MPKHRNRIEILQGTLDLLILQTLQWGPQHGYGITQAIRIKSSDVLSVDTGSLYPADKNSCSDYDQFYEYLGHGQWKLLEGWTN